MALDPAVAEDLIGPGVEGPPVGSHTAGRGMGRTPLPSGPDAPGEMVNVGNSVAPAAGDHEPSEDVGGATWYADRSQTNAAADPGTDIRQSDGQVTIASPGHISGLPMEWAVQSMANSQPGWTFNPTLYNPSLADRDLYHTGNPRTAKPGPESQGMADEFPPAPGAPLGTRYGGSGRGGSDRGFFGKVVTRARARKVLGPRKPKARMFQKLPRGARRSPGNRHG